MTTTTTSSSPSRRADPRIPEQAVRPSRVWLLTNAPSPYQSELLTAIARHDGIDLAVRFMRAGSPAGRAVNSDFSGRTLWAVLPERCRDEVRLHPQALWESAFGRFDVFVLSGLYTSVTFLCCAVILLFRRKPWIVWLERPHSMRSRGGNSLIARLRDSVRSWLLDACTRVLCIGTAAREEYSTMLADTGKLDVLPYCCDLSRFDDVRNADIQDWRDRHGLAGQTVFLYSGQLTPRKGVDTLLRSFVRLSSGSDHSAMVLLGDGPEREELQSLVPAEQASRVHFLGHLAQEELPVVFRAADVFVFPSRHDGWGVVINEACAAGLPIIVTAQTGAARDLVRHGENGFVLDADDAPAFHDHMRELLNDVACRRQMGARSRDLVQSWSPEQGARRFFECIARALA